MNEKNTNTSQRFIIFSFAEDSEGNADRNNINIHFKYYSKSQMERIDTCVIERITTLVNDSPRYEDANCYLLNAQNADIVSEVLEPKEDNNNWVKIHEDSRKKITDYAVNFFEEGKNKVFDLSRKDGVFSLDNDDKNYSLTPRNNNKLNEFKAKAIPRQSPKKNKSRGFLSFFS